MILLYLFRARFPAGAGKAAAIQRSSPKEREETVTAFSLENPHLGQVQIAAQLRKSTG
ncbi:hypothetical protein [Xenorhabdus sp. Sc-CR9]|uniref:hypothetical protein n=1 Tax=Xenorhabdus sp. Sc-CR9 TaxID=2584468 RepID=UPI001F451004|nr:hypothetical protein [Xenorhabdus sp. Sc-CR9]